MLQSQTKLGHLDQTPFFSFSCSPCPSQSCLSRFNHQTWYTNSEGTRRHKSVPTILTETVASFMCVYNYCIVWYNGKYIIYFFSYTDLFPAVIGFILPYNLQIHCLLINFEIFKSRLTHSPTSMPQFISFHRHKHVFIFSKTNRCKSLSHA